MKKFINNYALLFSIAGVIVLLDQWTKYLVRTNLSVGEVYKPDLWLSQYIRIVHWHNTGAAFGLFQNMSTIFTILAFVVAGLIIFYFPQVPKNEWALRIAMGFQLGGALGNLIDRLRQGSVVDFFSVGNFPVFNVADASITIGCVILFIGLWAQERQLKKAKSLEESEAASETDITEEGPTSVIQ